MAEIAGLVIGAVALAFLFDTSIALLERFESATNYAYDYDLACTKLGMLKVRLSAWGVLLNIEAPGSEHPALRQHCTEEKDVIGRSLLGIRDAFQDASVLAGTYRLIPKRLQSSRSSASRRSEARQFREPEATKPAVKGWAFMRKRRLWVIHDNHKFDVLIQDLSFLIENLEKVAERVDMPSAEQLAQIKVEHKEQWQKQAAQGASKQPEGQLTKPFEDISAKQEEVNVERIAAKINGNL
jgi:hypothetical protein